MKRSTLDNVILSRWSLGEWADLTRWGLIWWWPVIFGLKES
jgi:hypothetical protein